jgi:dTDP-4-dehydrorhamnose reductase
MSGERLFVFGFGYSASATAARMRPRLAAISGTTRDDGKLVEMEAMGVAPFHFDGETPSCPSPQGEGKAPFVAALHASDLVLVSIAPDAEGDPVLRHFHAELAAAKPETLVYLSTVGVYGDHAGAWVDETSECRPTSKRSQERLAAENAWRSFGDEAGVPVAIIRLAGIYGPGRGPFEKIRRGTARRIVKAGQVFNRIHVDDIAQIVEAVFERRAEGIFNGVDDEPSPPEEVLTYAAKLLDLPPPPEAPFEKADLSPMARSFYGESKRVRNDKIKSDLGVRLAYPSYREGLEAILAAEALAPQRRPPLQVT